MKFEEGANCNGVITSVEFCFNAYTQTADEHLATIATYRRNGVNTYTAVSSAITLRITQDQEQIQFTNVVAFNCSTVTLDQPLPIEMGDVLGVCVFDPPGDIDLVGEVFDDTGERYFSQLPAPDSCTETMVPESVDASHDSSGVLYLPIRANIGM